MLRTLWILPLLLCAHLARAQEDNTEDLGLQSRLQMSRHATDVDVEWAEARRRLLEEGLTAESDSLILLTALGNVGRAHEILGHWGPAIENYDRARALAERHLAADDLRLARPLRDLANVLRIVNVAPPAEEFFARALQIQEKHLGMEHAEVAETLRQRMRLWLNLSDLDRAESDAQRALEIAEKQDPGSGTLLPACMQARARVYNTRGQFDASFDMFQRAETLMRARVSGDHVGLADLLNDFSRHLQLRGDLRHARQLLEEAAGILLKKFSADHVYNIVVQANLAELNSKEGDFAAALRLLTRQAEAMKQAFGAEHPRVAELLNGQAGNHLLLGDAEAAVALYLETLNIYLAAYGETHLSVGQTRSNLAAAYQELERYEDAQRELLLATQILRESAGAESFLYIHSLTSLGELQLEAGQLELALITLRQAADAAEAVLGPQHPLLAETLLNLGQAERDLGEPQMAAAHWETALEIASAQGPENPLRAEAAMQLAGLELAEDLQRAFEHALIAEQVSGAHLRLLSRGASQADALRYARRRARGLPILMEVARRAEDPVLRERAWDALIRSRALVFDELAERALITRSSADPELEPKKEALRSARERIARLVADPSDRLSEEEHASLLAFAAGALRSAEEELAEASQSYRARTRSQTAGGAEIRDALAEEETLVGFYRHEWDASGNYLAFVLDQAGLRWIDLGDAETIDAAIRRWRDEATSGSVPPGPLAQVQRTHYFEAASALRRLLWDPLKLERTAGRIFLVPDGALHQLSFAALPTEDGRYLLEESAELHYLSAERDLVAEFPKGGSGMLAVGGADFGTEAQGRLGGTGCRSAADLSFHALPSSADEVRHLESFPATQTLLGADATEANFSAAASSHEILHIATHGFFLPTDCEPLQSPLLRCGLAFAGANERGGGEADRDGILSGEEILSLELDPVEWVVLSACDTGVGDDVEGAGLLGLRRAFRWSGANTLVSSLWAVEDEATQELMLELYRQRFELHMDSSRALREAQLVILERRRANDRSDHPFHWAGFVASGDWN